MLEIKIRPATRSSKSDRESERGEMAVFSRGEMGGVKRGTERESSALQLNLNRQEPPPSLFCCMGQVQTYGLAASAPANKLLLRYEPLAHRKPQGPRREASACFLPKISGVESGNNGAVRMNSRRACATTPDAPCHHEGDDPATFTRVLHHRVAHHGIRGQTRWKAPLATRWMFWWLMSF